jgi:riboflavin synthase alpha subunit
MEGLDIGYGNPLPVSGTISNAVEVSQWDANSLNATVVQAVASSLNATVTQAGTVTVAATALDTRALTSATDTVTVTGTVLVNPGGLNLPATVFQDDPTELHATVVQAGPVTTQGNSLLVKTVVVSESSAVQFLVDRPCTLHGYSFTTTAGRAVVHYYDADSTDSVTTSTVPAFSTPVETNQTALTFGNGDHITFASGLAVRINDNYNYTGTIGPGTSSITVYYR